MTHFNTNLRLPVRTGPSPMEDAIVQQVEWYMGRLNLEKDEYLKDQMDDDLWVSLEVILNFPKMQRIGVQDKRRVATLLHARSTIVEVDEKTARIRPAWARRSTIVIHDIPANARLDQVASLFQIPSNADLSNASAVPPAASHPPGLISIQPAAETIWLAIFDSPTGAQDSMHLLLDKEINGRKVNPEVHVENALRPKTDPYRQSEAQHQPSVYRNPRPVDSPQPNSGPYAQVSPMMSAGVMSNQMLNPMGMPMPVMHHPAQDAHPQYTYAPPPPTSYTPGYPPQNMAVPRQFMGAPRGMHAGYVMTYPQAGHPYDPSHAVPMQPHPVRAQQQQQRPPVDQSGVPVMQSTPISAEGATTSQVPQPVPVVPNGGTAAPTPGETIEGVEAGPEYVQDSGISQVQADAQRIGAQMPYTAPMQIPVMAGQPIDGQIMMAGQVKPVDMHYLHRTPIMGDPNVYGRGGGRQTGMGRDRNGQRNTDGGMRASGRGPMMDGQRGSALHRKGKKGNRGSTRHGHGHDRDRRDGKGDGSGSDSGNRDDRRYDKSKPEPNLASMHFPPLPVSETAGSRAAPLPKVVKKDDTEDKAPSTASTSEPKEAVPNGNEEVPSPEEAKTETTRSEGETTSPTKDVSEKEIGTEEPVTETKDSKAAVDGDHAETSTQDSGTSKEDGPPAEGEKKSESKAPAAPASSPMSYAAILRSKKPGPSPRPAAPPVSRSSSGASGKNGDSNSGSEASSSSAPHPPKEKSGRRRKSSSQRNNHTGDTTKDGNSTSIATKNDKGDKNADKHASDAPSLIETKDVILGGSENGRSKPVVENTRAHPVWVNKPKSLFQPASTAPAVRPSTPQIPIDSKKATSPVSSQGDEKEAATERGSKDAVDRNSPNGQPNGSLSAGPSKETGSDVNTNGDVESKEVREVSTSKVVKSSSKTGGDGTKNSKGSKGPEKSASVPAKGAWAAGGPKTWPKNSGNGVMEKTSNTTES